VSTDPGLASSGVGVRVAVSYRDGWVPGGARGTGPVPAACAGARDRTRNRGGEGSEGSDSQESTGGRPHPGQGRGRRRTDSRGEQGFEAGVPAVNRRAQGPREGDGTCGALIERVEATGLATAGNLRPGSCVPVRLRAGFKGKELGANGESDRESLESSALAAVEREPARKQRPARAGTAPREGKAL